MSHISTTPTNAKPQYIPQHKMAAPHRHNYIKMQTQTSIIAVPHDQIRSSHKNKKNTGNKTLNTHRPAEYITIMKAGNKFHNINKNTEHTGWICQIEIQDTCSHKPSMF
jgi:1,2-phenylacetyl-CoA epoxidase PaaB subunit